MRRCRYSSLFHVPHEIGTFLRVIHLHREDMRVVRAIARDGRQNEEACCRERLQMFLVSVPNLVSTSLDRFHRFELRP